MKTHQAATPVLAITIVLILATACAGAPTPQTPTLSPPTSVPPTVTHVAPTERPNATTATRVEPTTTRVVPTATRAGPTPTIVYYPIRERAWQKIPTIVISAAKNDPRILGAHKAVEFWNQQLKELGSSFSLGSVTETTQLVPAADLVAIGNPDAPGRLSPGASALVGQMQGDIVIALSDASFVSITLYVGAKTLIGIQANPAGLNSLSVDQNVIAHELGHAIGLGHNNDPTKLMCGRPAPCRPDDWPKTDGFVPITDQEKAYLMKIYPPTWKPTN